MVDFLHYIFVAPFIFIMQAMLEYSYSIVHSYGVAIILVSLLVKFLLIPLYRLAEKWQQAEHEQQQRMAAKKDELKKVYRGQERFMMLKTLYRQHHYHPIMAIKSSFGFLIQIPFFLAAYLLLSQYTPLNGHAFGMISDLGMPDNLVHLGSWHINALPFIMTTVSMLGAFLYTQDATRQNQFQHYGLPLLLVLLL